MLKIIILNQLSQHVIRDIPATARLIAMRSLTRAEIALAKEKKLHRWPLPCLGGQDVSTFYSQFDAFWDQAIRPFDRDHFFWRNVVSSKMQEWERSAAYFALILFSMAHAPDDARQEACFVFLCASLQEEEVVTAWARRYGWSVMARHAARMRWFDVGMQEIGNHVRFFRFMAVCFYRKAMAVMTRVELPSQDQRPVALVASLFYPSSFKDGKYTDPFFGPFHRRQENKDIRCLYLCDALSLPDVKLKQNMEQCQDVEVAVPYALLSIKTLVLVLWRVYGRRLRFPRSEFMGIDFSRLLSWNARRFSDYWNIHAEIFFEATRALCQKEDFKRFLYIYEGNVFERACVQAFRQFSSGHVLGYNHGALDRLNLKLRLTAGEINAKPEPDAYICTGPYARQRFAGMGHVDLSRIWNGCSLKSTPIGTRPVSGQPGSDTILVALDGLYSSVGMLDWLFDHADIFKGYKVRLRAHPNVPFDKLQGQCLQTKPDLFEVSCRELKADITECFCVIYRQSSVGIHALQNGVPAIYLAIDMPLPGDPIEDLSTGKWVARTPHELSLAIKEVRALDDQGRQALMHEASVFSERYFAEPVEEKLKYFLREEVPARGMPEKQT